MRYLAVILVVLTAGACNLTRVADPPATERSVDITVADLAGTWRNDQRDGSITFDTGGRWFGDKLGLAFMFGDPDLNNRYVYVKAL